MSPFECITKGSRRVIPETTLVVLFLNLLPLEIRTQGCAQEIQAAEKTNSTEVVIQVKIGNNLIANQVINGRNRLVDLLPSVPIGTTIFFFDQEKGISSDVFLGSWMKMADRVIPPGQGFILSTRIPFPWKQKGHQIEKPTVRDLKAGQHVIGNLWPVEATFASVIGRPPLVGEKLHKGVPLGRGESDYAKYEFTESGWNPEKPTLAIGEAAWFELQEAAGQ